MSTGAEVNPYEVLFQTALERALDAYQACDFNPLTEADWQCHLWARLLQLLEHNQIRPVPLHANWRLSSAPEGISRAKFDLVLGCDDVVVEIKFEADYPGVSKPVCFPRKVAEDVDRLNLARGAGASDGHLLVIDEDGALHRSLQKYITPQLTWRPIRRAAAKQSYFLDLHV